MSNFQPLEVVSRARVWKVNNKQFNVNGYVAPRRFVSYGSEFEKARIACASPGLCIMLVL